MKKLIYIILIIIAVSAIGYWFTSIKTVDHETSETVSLGTKTTAEAAHGAKRAGTRIDLDNVNNLKPGSITLSFKLYGIDAHEFGPNDLKVVHEKPIHLILLRDDVTGFQHIHPEYTDGRWIVETTIADEGLYQMYVDIEPKEEKPTVLRVPLTIGGITQQPQFPRVSANMSAITSGIQATLQLASPLKTKENTNLTFSLTQNGKPVTHIDPYLGAFGHVVIFHHGYPDGFIHGHPITEVEPTEGSVVFESEFPMKGTYTIFAQFSIDGQVRIFPITILVDSEGQASTNTDAQSGSGH